MRRFAKGTVQVVTMDRLAAVFLRQFEAGGTAGCRVIRPLEVTFELSAASVTVAFRVHDGCRWP